MTILSYNRGHTAHFYLGKNNDLPRENSLEIARGKFISGLFSPGKKIRKGHTTEIDTWGCHVSVFETWSIDRLEINPKMQPKLKWT